MRSIAPILTAILSLAVAADAFAELSVQGSHQDPEADLLDPSQVDDREVYVVTSKVRSKFPRVCPFRHASIAICPRGVSPIVYENGVPVSNCRQCKLYGTQLMDRGFRPEPKRIDAKATRVHGISASMVEQRMRSHRQKNVPILHDCRHHAIQVLELRNRRGRLKAAFALR